MKTILFATLASLVAVPAAAQTAPIIIYDAYPDRVTSAPSAATEAEQVEIAAKAACEAPYIRNLKGQQLYAECLAEARAEAAAILAERALAGTELAAR